MDRSGCILVVDDELETRETLAEYLGERGYSVTTASDGDRALQLLQSGNRYDLVLLDVVMPGRSGLAVLDAMQNLEESCSVVLMTAWAPLQNRISSLKLGSHDLLRKPFTPDALDEVLTRSMPDD